MMFLAFPVAILDAQSVDSRQSFDARVCRAESVRCHLNPDAEAELSAAGHYQT